MRALALALALLPAAVAAQEPAPAPDPAWENCSQLANQVLTDLTGLEAYAMIQARPDGWCEAMQLSLPLAGRGGPILSADSLRWRSEGLLDYAHALAEGSAETPPPPDRLELVVEGAWLYALNGDPMLDWLMAAQSVPTRIDGTLSLAATTESRIEMQLDLDIPHGNAIRVKAEVEGADLTSPAAVQASLGRIALSRLSARITTRDLFETRLLPVLAPVVIGDARQPEALLLQERLRARVAIERLPPEIFPDPTRAELYELLTALPNPSGTLSLEVETGAGGGLGFSRFLLSGLPASTEELWPALDGVTVSADWAAEPR